MWFNFIPSQTLAEHEYGKEPKVLEKLQAAPEFWASSLEECGAQSVCVCERCLGVSHAKVRVKWVPER